MLASHTSNPHISNNRLPSNRPICAHRRSSADKTPRRTRTSAQSLFSTGFWQTADIDDIRFTGSNLKTTTSFTYNNANELTSMTMTPGGTTTFTYDDWGRMIQKANSGFTADYAYRYGSMIYNVDSNFPGEGDVTYEYGANGKRRVRTHDSDHTQYRYGKGYKCISVEAGADSFVYCGPQLSAVKNLASMNSEWNFFIRDHNSTITGIQSDAGLTTQLFNVSSYGLASHNASDELVSYGGMAWDRTAGLYLAAYRTFSSISARWTARDPLGLIGGTNSYEYCDGNPISELDPLGLLTGNSFGASGNGYDGIGIYYRGPDDCDCEKIAFIQMVRSRPFGLGKFGNPQWDWHLDTDDKSQPFYPLHLQKGRPTGATMEDDPGFPNIIGSLNVPGSQDFETCAVCAMGNDKGKIYGCMKWGARTPLLGITTYSGTGDDIPGKPPSDDFLSLLTGIEW